MTVTDFQLATLRALWSLQTSGPKHLAYEMRKAMAGHVEPRTVASALGRLVRAGLVRHMGDGLYTITPDGQKLVSP